MSISLLNTKFFIPTARSKLVSRPLLIEKLNKGIHRKLAILSAPAGFGKTTLLTEWLNNIEVTKESKIRIAWFSIDEGDNELVRFLSYFISALNQNSSGGFEIGGDVLELLNSPQLPQTEELLISLINSFLEFPEKIILVIDDYHLIDNTSVHDALSFFIEHIPSQLHLVIATREDPLLPLSILRAKDQMTELRAFDLRFSLTEAANFLNQVMGLTLSEENIAALEFRTEGWIAGLQLAAISLQGHDDASNFIDSFSGSHRFILDYLIEEVLEQQSENVQEFLLRTSILDRLCAPLCGALFLDTDISGQETLTYLEQTNLFIAPLDNERRWYRYQHLFADLLRQRLLQTYPEQISTLHSRASKWYEQNGFNDKAIEHSLSSGDFEQAAGLIELAWPAIDESFQSPKWLDWVKALPDEIVRTRPVLCVGYAWAYMNGGQMEDADSRLRDAERWLEPTTDMSNQIEDAPSQMVVVDEDQFRSLPASIATLRAFLAQAFDDVPGVVKYAQQALGLLPEVDYITRGRLAVILGIAYWGSGDLERGHQSYADGMANMRKDGNILFTIAGTFILADIRKTQGRLQEALRTYRQSLQVAADEGVPTLSGTEDLYRGMSEIYYEQGDHEAARQNLKRSEELSQEDVVYQYHLYIAQAQIKKTQGDLVGALDLLDEAKSVYLRSVLPDLRPISALKTRVWVMQGRLDEALGWVREQGLSFDDDLSYLCEFKHITLARLLIAQYLCDRVDTSINEAMGLLGRLLAAAEDGERTGSLIEILVLKALAHEAQGDLTPALVSLERALTLAEPEGYVRIFVDEGMPMLHLLSEVATKGILPKYISKLLAVFEDEKQKNDLSPSQQLVDPLSDREIEILNLIAAGLKNKEIAEQLIISLNTVLYHIKNIYRKLGVNKRTLAITKAKEIKII